MATLHIENTVREYTAWKAAFDRFDRVRADNGVRSYRVTRSTREPHQVFIDLDFATTEEAMAFAGILEKIWRTPRSAEVLADHGLHEVREVVDEQSSR